MSKRGCPHCGRTVSNDVSLCPFCGQSTLIAPSQQPDELQLMRGMTEPQRLLFATQMNGVRKHTTTATILAIFLGGIGAHHFYLGRAGVGVIYLLFSWTFIPVILGLLEAISMRSSVRRYNDARANELAAQIAALS